MTRRSRREIEQVLDAHDGETLDRTESWRRVIGGRRTLEDHRPEAIAVMTPGVATRGEPSDVARLLVACRLEGPSVVAERTTNTDERREEYGLMSSTDDTEQQRIDILEGHVTDEHLESIKNGSSTASDADAGGSGDEEVDVVEALNNYDAETLDDADEIGAEIEALQEKLDVVGEALPKSRRAEVRDTIEALQAATEAHSPLRTNSAEALAERIEVYQR